MNLCSLISAGIIQYQLAETTVPDAGSVTCLVHILSYMRICCSGRLFSALSQRYHLLGLLLLFTRL